MADFTGSTSKPRTISFVKKPTGPTKPLTQTVKEERERRALDKRRNSAAITIQATFRSSQTRTRARQTYQDMVRKKLGDLGKLSLLVKGFVVPTPIIRALIREFLFGFGATLPQSSSPSQDILIMLLNLIQGGTFNPRTTDDEFPFALCSSNLARMCLETPSNNPLVLSSANFLLTHLVRYGDFARSRCIKQVISLLHVYPFDVTLHALVIACVESAATTQAFSLLYDALNTTTTQQTAEIVARVLVNTSPIIQSSLFQCVLQPAPTKPTIPYTLWILVNIYFSSIPTPTNTVLFIQAAKHLMNENVGIMCLLDDAQRVAQLVNQATLVGQDCMLRLGSFLWSVACKYDTSTTGLSIRSRILLALTIRQRAAGPVDVLVDLFWQTLGGCSSPSSPGNNNSVDITSTDWYFCLCITSMATSLLLQSLDDVELFQRHRPFQCAPIAVETLKLILYDIAWVRDKDPQAELIELFSQLHARFARTTGNHGATLFQFPVLPPQELGVDGGSSGNNVRVDVVMDESNPVVTLRASPRGRRVLKNFAFVLPFTTRVQLFHQLLQKKKAEVGAHEESGFTWNPITNAFELSGRQSAKLRRSHVVFDTFAQLRDADFSKRIRVSFVNELGLEEAGIDGGGLFKEFLVSFVAQAMDPKFGLFEENSLHQLFPRRGAELNLLRLVGKIIGKAVYDGVLLQPTLASHVLNLLCGTLNTLHDLNSLDSALYQNLMWLKNLSPQELEKMELTFSIASSNSNSRDVDLIPDGSHIKVTKENLRMYFAAFADFRLNIENSKETDAFIDGFTEIIEQTWVRIFDSMELNMLIGGSLEPDFDVQELRKHAHYGGGYLAQQPYMHAFWDVVKSFTPEQRGSLLKFVTSCSRPPLTGFAALHPSFTIHLVPDATRLPSSSTCVNLLKLPQYESVEMLREKLLLAIESGAGFELT